MKQWIAFTAMTTLGAILGWLYGLPEPQEIPSLAKQEDNSPAESLLGERHSGWLEKWEQDLHANHSRPFKIRSYSQSDRWDEERKQITGLAHTDPKTAIAWIEENVSESKQRERMLRDVINPLTAADFRKALDILPNVLADSPPSHSLFYLFQYVPVRQLPDVASALYAMEDDDIRHQMALPDFMKLWADRDLDAAAAWLDSQRGNAKPMHHDLKAYLEASRVKEGAIPDGLEDLLSKASDTMLTTILKDLYDAALLLPGDPAEHAQKVLALTPASKQQNYARTLVSNWSRADPLGASDWALSFADPEIATQLLTNSLTAFYNYAPEKAEAWERAQSPEDRTLIAEARAVAKERVKRLPPP